MRYLLLFGILIAASVTLPFARVPDAPVGQPVPPVTVATLDAAGLPVTEAATTSAPEVGPGSEPGLAAAPPPDAPAPIAPAPVETSSSGPATGENVGIAAPAVLAASISALAPETAPASVPAATADPADAAPLPPHLPPHLPVPAAALRLVTLLPYGALAHAFDDTAGPSLLSGPLPAAIAAAGLVPGPSAAPPASRAPGAAGRAWSAPPRRAPSVDSEPLGPVDDRIATLTLERNPAPIVIARLDAPSPPAAEPAAAPKPEPAPAAAAPADAPRLVKVTASALNMRAGPSSSHPVVAGLARGAVAETLGEPRGGWVRVRLQDSDRTGWLFARYLERVGGA